MGNHPRAPLQEELSIDDLGGAGPVDNPLKAPEEIHLRH